MATRRVGRGTSRTSSRTANRRTLPERISLWLAANRRLVAGSVLAAFAAVFAVWVTMPSLPLDGQRETIIQWFGGGAYLVALVVAVAGVVIGVERARNTVRQDRVWIRTGLGIGLAALALWGIAGAITPQASLGGVSLAEHGAGGRVGGWLDSPIGWVAIVVGLLTSFALIWPATAEAGLRALGRAIQGWIRHLGQELREKGPRAVAALLLAIWRGLLWLLKAIWELVAWSGRELRLAFGVIGQQLKDSRRPTPETPANPQYPARPPVAAAPTPYPPPEPAWPPMSEATDEPVVEVAPPDPAQASAAPTPRPTLRTLDRTATDGWRLPPIDLLDDDPAATLRSGAKEQAAIIVETLGSFGVDASVTQINEGPAITQFGVEPGWEVKTRQVAVKDVSGSPVLDQQGRQLMQSEEVSRTRVRVSRITRLADDLALALAAPSIRIEAPVPGQPIVGIEVPNAETRIVALRSLIESAEFAEMAGTGGLPIALGRDVTGNPVIMDLTRMPHVLIAGATGSGKSVCINTIISSLLMQKSPAEVRLILVDPKRVELTNYGSAPHLAFSHVVTEPDEVVSVLGVVVAEMDRRYRLLEVNKARNIVAYNSLPGLPKRMPYWVVVLDELADMMMAAAAEVEGQLVRLAQLARAVGIHLVVATQRPSVDVVTGLIKANFPTRIAFATTSQTDARVIMDRAGAEKLMGRGDMLFMSSDTIKPRRVQGAFVSDAEIERILESWSAPTQGRTERSSLDQALDELDEDSPSAVDEAQARAAQADLRNLTETLESALDAEVEVVDAVDTAEAPRSDAEEGPDIVVEDVDRAPVASTFASSVEDLDTRLGEATELAKEYERVSAMLLQRRMRVGRPRAERLIEQLEQTGVVEQSDGGRSRRVLTRADRRPGG